MKLGFVGLLGRLICWLILCVSGALEIIFQGW